MTQASWLFPPGGAGPRNLNQLIEPCNLTTFAGRSSATYPVIVLVLENTHEYFRTYTKYGKHNIHEENHYLDLIEINEYDDFEIDEPVMVRNSTNTGWNRRYFAGIDENNEPTTYRNGETKWTNLESYVAWNYCRRPTKEELNS